MFACPLLVESPMGSDTARAVVVTDDHDGSLSALTARLLPIRRATLQRELPLMLLKAVIRLEIEKLRETPLV